MRTIAAAFLCILLAGSAFVPRGAAAAVPGCSHLTLTAHPAYPPVAWAHDGTLEGAGIDIVRRIATGNGVSVSVIDEGSWKAAQTAVKTGKADAIVGLYLTGPRQQYFDYVQPAIAPDPSAVIVRSDSTFVYRGWNSLMRKRGAVSRGEQYGTQFDTFMENKLRIQRVNGFKGVYDAVLSRRADYGLIGFYSAETGAPAGIRIAEPNFVTEGLYIAFGKQSKCASLIPAFSAGVKWLQARGATKMLFDQALRTYKSGH